MGIRRTIAPNIELDYTPRELFLPFHQRKERWGCIVAHRRAGKTVACINELVIRAIYSRMKNPQYGYVAPYRQQAKNIAWVYLKDAVNNFAIEVRESDLSVTLPNGAKITLYGSDNPDALRGLYFDGIIIDEFGDCRPQLWAEVILPTLADRKGWAVVIGTPKGRNQFYDFYELSKKDDRWFSLTIKADTSGLLDNEELEQLKAQMSEGQYDQEMLCSFTAALLGTYYATLIAQLESDNRVTTKAEHDPGFPVTVAMDIGYSDSTVLWFFQERPDGIAYIDVEEGHGKELQYYFDLLDHTPYSYDTIWLPHDARAKTLQTGKSTADQFIEKFRNTDISLDIVPQLSVQHGIEAVRLILPYAYFHPRCELGIEALRTYRRKYNELQQRFEDKPLHSWESDFADAFRYSALVANKKKLKPPEPVSTNNPDLYPGYCISQLFADRERKHQNPITKHRI